MPEFLWIWTTAFGSHGLRRRKDTVGMEHFCMYLMRHPATDLVSALIRSAAGSPDETWPAVAEAFTRGNFQALLAR